MREIQVRKQNINTLSELEDHEGMISPDLYEEAESFLNDSISVIIGRYQVWDPEDEYEDINKTGSFVFADGRIGIEYGTDARWADVSSIQEGLHLYFNDPEEYDSRM